MAELIQRTTAVLPIVDILYQDEWIHPELNSEIQATPTRQGRMRLLYERAITPGGTRVKSAFYQALMKEERHLMDDLSTILHNYSVDHLN